MRAIWTGAIGFGLVNIPVRIFTATQESTIDLDMLDKDDLANIRYARINADTGKEVPWANIIKGYKLNDEYIPVTDKDFEQVNPKKSKLIEIEEFMDIDAIDSTYYETPYYLEPSKGGEKAYVLLREALKESGKIAVGQFVMRTKENLCILKPQGDMLLLQKIRYAEEIRSYEDLNIPSDITIKPAELKMAQALIRQLSPKKTSITKYKDTYDQELMKIIEAKAKGKKVKQPQFKLVHNKTKDLMAQLKASLEPKPKIKKAS
ncbi:MAG: Ku protein [Taibaiella sp.]|nr:Ku protein [Taibaiella sp.]